MGLEGFEHSIGLNCGCGIEHLIRHWFIEPVWGFLLKATLIFAPVEGFHRVYLWLCCD